MGDFSRSLYWDEEEEYSEENWQQGAMDSAIHNDRYLSGPESPPSPHISPLPEDDPVFHRSPQDRHYFPLPPYSSVPMHYRQTYQSTLRDVRRAGRRGSATLEEYKDQIFQHVSGCVVLRLRSFFSEGASSSELVESLNRGSTILVHTCSSNPYIRIKCANSSPHYS